jgi:hypothetical protein
VLLDRLPPGARDLDDREAIEVCGGGRPDLVHVASLERIN